MLISKHAPVARDELLSNLDSCGRLCADSFVVRCEYSQCFRSFKWTIPRPHGGVNPGRKITRDSPRDCISAYSTEFLSTRGNLVTVTTSSSTVNGSLLQFEQWYGGADPFGWICNNTYRAAENAQNTFCQDIISNVLVHADDWRPSGNAGFRVQHCLSEKVNEMCSLQFSEIIIIVVIICNLAKFVVMSLTAFKLVWHPIVTIGDGIASFLADPDERTEGMCLLTARKANLIEWKANSANPLTTDLSPVALPWKPENLRWFRAASFRRWFFCSALYSFP